MDREDRLAWISGLIIGAAAMYFLDPLGGPSRRTAAADALRLPTGMETPDLAPAAEPAPAVPVDATAPAAAEARAVRMPSAIPVSLATAPLSDDDLAQRVRDALVRMAHYPVAVQVDSDDFIVTLRGEVAEHELGYLLVGLRSVPGVRRLETYLRTYKVPERRPVPVQVTRQAAEAISTLPGPVSPVGRALLGLAGAVLAGAGLRRGGVPGAVSAAMGGMLMARAAVNEVPSEEPAYIQPRVASVRASIEVEAPVQKVFSFWSSFRNFSRFLGAVREVRETESGTAQWELQPDEGASLAWETEITGLRPHRRIGWRTLAGSPVDFTGEVEFEELESERTRVTACFTYCIPPSSPEEAVPEPFGPDPQRALEESLERMKGLLEVSRARTP